MMEFPASALRPSSIRAFAHRGGMAHRRENTIEAFGHALAMGIRGVETDAWLTADGVPVLCHDGVVVTPMGRKSIASLQSGDLPHELPSLATLYKTCGTGFDIAIDVLDPAAAGPLVAAAVAAGPGTAERMWLCSPNLAELASWRRLHPGIHLVHSDSRWRRHRDDPASSVQPLPGLGIEVLNLHHRHCAPEVVAACHGERILLFAWGVQHTWAMRRLVRRGVDGIMSDHVDRLLAAIDEPARGAFFRRTGTHRP